jgi:hypothetical protein
VLIIENVCSVSSAFASLFRRRKKRAGGYFDVYRCVSACNKDAVFVVMRIQSEL